MGSRRSIVPQAALPRDAASTPAAQAAMAPEPVAALAIGPLDNDPAAVARKRIATGAAGRQSLFQAGATGFAQTLGAG